MNTDEHGFFQKEAERAGNYRFEISDFRRGVLTADDADKRRFFNRREENGGCGR